MDKLFTQVELILIQALIIRELKRNKQLIACVDESNTSQVLKISTNIELLSSISHKVTAMLKEYEE